MTRHPAVDPSVTYSDEAFVDAVRTGVDGRAPITTEVAEIVDCAVTTAHNRCHALAKDGVLDAHPVGDVVLWTPIPGVFLDVTDSEANTETDSCLRCGDDLADAAERCYVELEPPLADDRAELIAGHVCAGCERAVEAVLAGGVEQ